MEDPYASILGCVLITNDTGGILAAIVYEEQFKVRIGLGEDAVYATVQELLRIIDGNDY